MSLQTSAKWYDEPDNEVHGTVTKVYRTIQNQQGWRLEADRYHAALYAGGSAAANISMPRARVFRLNMRPTHGSVSARLP